MSINLKYISVIATYGSLIFSLWAMPLVALGTWLFTKLMDTKNAYSDSFWTTPQAHAKIIILYLLKIYSAVLIGLMVAYIDKDAGSVILILVTIVGIFLNSKHTLSLVRNALALLRERQS